MTPSASEDMVASMKANGMEAASPSLGSFVHPTDGRIQKTGVTIFRGSRSVTTTSFDTNTLECRGCSGHQEKKIWKDRANKEGHRQVILLTDQCYPAMLLAHGPAMCLKIVRREYGSLNQMVAELMDLARGKIIEKDSLILIFSRTHLARVGTVAYIEDLMAAVAAIKSVLGQEVKVAPLPPSSWAAATARWS
jgi:hypothetical protein